VFGVWHQVINAISVCKITKPKIRNTKHYRKKIAVATFYGTINPLTIMVNLTKGIGVVGSTTIDKIVAGDHTCLKQGGVTTYAGYTYCRHGIPTLIVSNLALQDARIIDRFQTAGIEVIWEAVDHTTHFINHIRQQGRCQHVSHLAPPITGEPIKKIVNRIDGLHLGPLHPLDVDPDALDFLLNARLKIFLDIQGYTRKVENQKVTNRVSDHLTAGLNAADIIKANWLEYQCMLAHYHMNLTELMIRFNIKESVITLGDKGGFVQKQNGAVIGYSSATVKFPVDPTGAGDVFFAAYLAGRLSRQMPIPDACRDAARIAAQQVEGKYITLDHIGLGNPPYVVP
jgi:sugar/nucleoside kinase (ribokinase family)